MKWDVTPYRDTVMDYAKVLLGQDSPSGFTAGAVDAAEEIARGQGYATRRDNKGNLTILVPGRDHSKTVGLCAHVDTLGLMVRSVTADGRLLVTRIGGPLMPTLDGEYCRIYTRNGKVYTGTILSLSPAAHVEDDAATRTRDEKNMAVRIDEVVHSREEVHKLGICPGDYVCYDPKTQVTPSGFLKSRFLDDKASAACLLTTLKILRAYAQLEDQEVSGQNITAAMSRIEGMMDKVVEGFEKQLDLLFQGDAMDITTDVEVLERMLAKDGLSDRQGLTLEL